MTAFLNKVSGIFQFLPSDSTVDMERILRRIPTVYIIFLKKFKLINKLSLAYKQRLIPTAGLDGKLLPHTPFPPGKRNFN